VSAAAKKEAIEKDIVEFLECLARAKAASLRIAAALGRLDEATAREVAPKVMQAMQGFGSIFEGLGN
jgi:hypothetical protein